MSFVKDPDAVLDYAIDWTDWLASRGSDTISASAWIVPDGITKDSDEFTDTVATIWLSGGTAGETYSLTNRVTTAGGRVQDKTIKIKVKEQ